MSYSSEVSPVGGVDASGRCGYVDPYHPTDEFGGGMQVAAHLMVLVLETPRQGVRP